MKKFTANVLPEEVALRGEMGELRAALRACPDSDRERQRLNRALILAETKYNLAMERRRSSSWHI